MDERWKRSHHLLFLQILFISSMLVSGKKLSGATVAEADYKALKAIKLEFIDFRGVLSSWNLTGDAVCSTWSGIKCLNGRVTAIQLPWKGLGGRISDKIGLLRSLRHLSLHDNALTGPVPSSLGSLPDLRGVFLFNNRLSGSIPPTFGNCLNLQILDLSSNQLTGIAPANLANSSRLYRLNLGYNKISGSIPVSLFQSPSLTFLALEHNNISGEIEIPTSLSKNRSILTVLNLSHNQIVGNIPDELGKISKLSFLDLSENNLTGEIPITLVDMPNLTSFDVSYNDLSGSVPSLLATRFNSSSFIGNTQLCGYSSSIICPTPEPENLPSSPQKLKHQGRKLSTRDIILIAAGAIVAVLLILCCVFLCCLVGGEAKNSKKSRGLVSGGGDEGEGGEIGGKLVHLDGTIVFAADDLLCATAEIMGKSAYGTAYKATMGDYNQVAVKRLREKMTKARKEFEIEVAQLGRIRHPNVSPLRAYYIGPKGEKLLVYDYMPQGSLASFLHARGPETSIPWPTRMAIACGIAQGLTHLHTEENIIHGNLTSSNILLDEQSNPKIADVGLPRLMAGAANTDSISASRSMGYRAPELAKVNNPNTKSDVYSFGVIVLELLTGKSPSEVSDGLCLPQWVASIVKEEWTSEVFDEELMRDAPNIGEELLNMLKLALHCVDPAPQARPEARQVLKKLDETQQAYADEAAAVVDKSE